MTVKITIHTMSTKSQYSPTSSTRSDCSVGRRPATDIPNSTRSIRTPMVTWAPWKPVRTKKLEPNRLRLSVAPSLTTTVNSCTWPPRKVIPRRAVASSHTRSRRSSPRWMALRASTMVRLDIRRTNELTEVYGMSYTCSGNGPWMLRPRYSRYVEIRAPKNRHSEPRNAHMPSLRLSRPVAVTCTPCAAPVMALCWATELVAFLGHRLHAPAEQPRQGEQPPEYGDRPVVDQAVPDDREPGRRQQREVGRIGHVDVVPLLLLLLGLVHLLGRPGYHRHGPAAPVLRV